MLQGTAVNLPEQAGFDFVQLFEGAQSPDGYLNKRNNMNKIEVDSAPPFHAHKHF